MIVMERCGVSMYRIWMRICTTLQRILEDGSADLKYYAWACAVLGNPVVIADSRADLKSPPSPKEYNDIDIKRVGLNTTWNYIIRSFKTLVNRRVGRWPSLHLHLQAPVRPAFIDRAAPDGRI